jgi:hypothetical protein
MIPSNVLQRRKGNPHQVADLIDKSQLTGRWRGGRLHYVFSEEPRTTYPTG